MNNNKSTLLYLIFSILLLIPTSISAQLPKKVDGDNIKKIISIISSDEYQGRETGKIGSVMVEDYFANEFKKLKLIPAGDKGSYYYDYSIKDEAEDEKPLLSIDDRSFYSGWGEDFNLSYRSDGGNAEAEIVFAGYGIYCPEKKRNDYDSIDIKGKIVLIRRGAPRKDISGWRPYSIDSVKAEYCYKNGAVGVLFYSPTERTVEQNLVPYYNNSLGKKSVLRGFPVFTVDERVARFVFLKTKKSYWRISSTMDRQNVSFSTGKKCKMSAKASSGQQIKTRNVLAMLPGSDPKLKNEYILIGGHIDHIGIGQDSVIRNGADDNASGPSVALGIAQAMVKNKYKPKRSIIFVGWTGEEKGLLGSKAWCEKPTIDLKKIVVYFNLDMVGLGDGKLDMPGTDFAPEVYEFIKKNTDTTSLKQINWEKGGLGGSDHNYFLMKGVPAFAGMTSGPHPDYHQAGDDADKIKADILQMVGDFIYHSTEKIASSKENFISENRFNENKIKLVDYHILTPIFSNIIKADLENKNANLAIIDFSDIAKSENPQENFISLLKGFDSNKAGDRFLLATNPYEAVYSKWMEKFGLLATFNPQSIEYDETLFKVLAKFGYRFATVNNNSKAITDTTILKKLIKLANGNGVGLVLNNLPTAFLEKILKKAKNPCLVLSNDPISYSDNLISIIKANNHLVVYQINNKLGVQNTFENYEVIKKKIGNELITISPEDLSENNYNYFKQFLLKFLATYPNKDDQAQIFTDNFIQFASKSLQVRR
ncbi:MAG: M20/M25/M40 family metallo-hydrolase [Tenuifilaceae bacterium]